MVARILRIACTISPIKPLPCGEGGHKGVIRATPFTASEHPAVRGLASLTLYCTCRILGFCSARAGLQARGLQLGICAGRENCYYFSRV